MDRRPHRRNSGQVLIITSMIVVLLLVSTVVYVTESQKNAPVYHGGSDIDFRAFMQAASHTVISALANVSNGGSSDLLISNLNRLKAIATNYSYSSIVSINYSIANAAPYSNGFYSLWGSDGVGISSAVINCVLNASGIASSYYSEFTLNATSSINVSGYNTLQGSNRYVTVICSVFNGGNPTGANNLTLYYQQKSPATWLPAPSPTTVNYGNGTYQITFTTTKQATADALPVSIHCQDTQGILIRANVTLAKR